MRTSRNVSLYLEEITQTLNKINEIVTQLTTIQKDKDNVPNMRAHFVDLQKEATDGLAIIRDINSISNESGDAMSSKLTQVK